MNPGEDKAEFSLSSEFFKKLNQQIVQKDNLIKLLQLQIKNLKAQIEEGAGEGGKKAEMAKLLEAKEAEIKNLEAGLQAQKSELADALTEKDEQIKALNLAVEQAQQKMAHAEAAPVDDPRLPELQATVSRLEEEVLAERQKREEFENLLQAEKDRAAAEVGQLQSNLDTLSPAASETEDMRKQVAQLQEEVNRHANEAIEKDSALQKMQGDLQKFQIDLAAKEAEMAQLQGQLAQVPAAPLVAEPPPEMANRISELESDIATLKGLLEEKDLEISSLRSQASSGAGEADAGLIASLSAAQAEATAAREELAGALSGLASKQAEIESLRADLVQTREQASASVDQASQSAELQAQLESLQSQVQRIPELEAKLAQAESESASLAEAGMKLAVVESERAQWTAERDGFQSKLRSMGLELETGKKQLAEREAAIAAQQTRMIDLERRLQDAGTAGENDPAVRAEIDQLTNQVADQLLAIQKFEQILRSTQEELGRRDEEIALLQKKLAEGGSGKAISLASDSEVLAHFIDFFDGLDTFLLQNPLPELQTLHRQLLDRLILPNQIEYMPVIAEDYDPARHVATDYFRSDKFGEKTIVFEVEKGYRRGNSVVKKAKVWVVQNLFGCPSCSAVQVNPESRFCNLCGSKIVAPNGLPVETLPAFEPTPTTYLRFADRMIELHKSVDAKKFLLDGLTLDPNFVPLLTRLADVHALNSEFGEAISVLQKAASLKPEPKLMERIKALEVKNTIFKQALHLNLPPEEFEKLVRLIKE